VGTMDQNRRFVSELKAMDSEGAIPRGKLATA